MNRERFPTAKTDVDRQRKWQADRRRQRLKRLYSRVLADRNAPAKPTMFARGEKVYHVQFGECLVVGGRGKYVQIVVARSGRKMMVTDHTLSKQPWAESPISSKTIPRSSSPEEPVSSPSTCLDDEDEVCEGPAVSVSELERGIKVTVGTPVIGPAGRGHVVRLEDDIVTVYFPGMGYKTYPMEGKAHEVTFSPGYSYIPTRDSDSRDRYIRPASWLRDDGPG